MAWGTSNLSLKPDLQDSWRCSITHLQEILRRCGLWEKTLLSLIRTSNMSSMRSKRLSLLLSRTSFLQKSAELAHVVLPACAFFEKSGTVSNTERRVQMMNKVVSPPGQAKDDWWIITEVAKRMGVNWNYKKPKDIFAEIRKVTPSYAGMTYERIRKELLQWPCPD